MSEPTGEFNPHFSDPEADARPWADVDAVLLRAEMFFLATVRKDGSPHVTPIPAIWDQGALHICTGQSEQKAVNLMADPRCVLSTGNGALQGGLDVVVEGSAVRVDAEARLRELAALWKSRLDWDFEVGDGGFDDGNHGLALVFAVTPVKVLAFGKDPYSQTRFRFDRG